MSAKIFRSAILVLVAAALALTGTFFSGQIAAKAATAAIGSYYASCDSFSIDLAVNGASNDGSNFDRFRYLITDGNGKKLYQEDATRQVGVTLGSLVVNMNYDSDGAFDGPPGKNPIKFEVLELDGNNNVIGVVQEVRYDAPCIAASGNTNRAGDFRPPHFVKGTILVTTQLYQRPGFGPIGINVVQGKEHFAVYRSGDAQWVAIDVSGNNLVWIPSNTVAVDLNRLNTPPTRIDLSDPTRLVTAPTFPQVGQPGLPPVVAPGVAIPGVSALTTTTLRLRARPTTRSVIVARIPVDTSLAVIGRNDRRTWIKVIFNGLPGWVSTGFIQLVGARLSDLPIVFE